VYFVANLLCYNNAKYFEDRSTTHRVIAKKQKGARFLKHSVVVLCGYDTVYTLQVYEGDADE